MTALEAVIVMRRRGTLGYLPGWIVAHGEHHAVVGTYAAALHFATRLTQPPRKEQAMTDSPVIHPQVGVLDAQHVIALAEHALKVDPQLLTAVADRQAIERVRDAVNDAWLER